MAKSEKAIGRAEAGLGHQSSLLSRFVWILAIAVPALLYLPVLRELFHVWNTNTYAVHGMFVPLFSAMMLWNDRVRLCALPGKRDARGLLVVLLGLGVLALGHWFGSLAVQALSVAISVAGLVLWGFGAARLRAAAFPIAFLVFMAPPPRALIEALTLQLQVFAAGVAGSALMLLQIPFYQSGVLIELPAMSLQVAEVCNGLRFLFALLVLTVAFAQVSQHGFMRKLALVLSAVPIAILANGLRVAVIAVGVHYVGSQVASGTIHHMIGKGVWVFTLVPLVVLAWVLRRGVGCRVWV